MHAKKDLEKIMQRILAKYPSLSEEVEHSGLIDKRYKLISTFYLDSKNLSINDAIEDLLKHG